MNDEDLDAKKDREARAARVIEELSKLAFSSGPNVPLLTGKSYLVPPINTDAPAEPFSTVPSLRRFSSMVSLGSLSIF